MRRAIYVGTVLGLLLGLTMIDFVILKELREFRKEMSSKKEDVIPTLQELKYYDEHKIQISNMEELGSYNNCLVLFMSDDCPMCDITKKDVAAFIYYGLVDIVDIYFVDIDECRGIVGETVEPDLSSQKIHGTPTMFELKDNSFQRYEGVDEIYDLLNAYAKM